MKGVVAYLMIVGLAAGGGLIIVANDALPDTLSAGTQLVQCMLMGAVGGVAYCLRGVYLSRSVRRDWSDDWITWYVIRPWVSLLCGGVAFVALQAGLLVLDANREATATSYGYLAFAFVAGLNVDGFLRRIEGVAEASWGIDPSRTARE